MIDASVTTSRGRQVVRSGGHSQRRVEHTGELGHHRLHGGGAARAGAPARTCSETGSLRAFRASGSRSPISEVSLAAARELGRRAQSALAGRWSAISATVRPSGNVIGAREDVAAREPCRHVVRGRLPPRSGIRPPAACDRPGQAGGQAERPRIGDDSGVAEALANRRNAAAKRRIDEHFLGVEAAVRRCRGASSSTTRRPPPPPGEGGRGCRSA